MKTLTPAVFGLSADSSLGRVDWTVLKIAQRASSLASVWRISPNEENNAKAAELPQHGDHGIKKH